MAVMRGENYIADGFTSNVDWVYSLDLLIGGVAGMAFIIIEGRRLKMRRLWLYIALAFVTAFAFVFPLFLGFRSLRLDKLAKQG
jgi:succinate dehydrogenase hydrophobic anchor subunit